MSFINLFLIGILVGSAMITPGVSGGVITVIFGIYNKMIYSLTNLFKNFKKNFPFLFILGIGILIGAIWFSNVMIFLYRKYEAMTKIAFMGLILGGIPYLFKEIKIKGNKNANGKVNYIALTVSFILSLLLLILSKTIFKIDLDSDTGSVFTTNLNLFLAGVIYSIGKIIPGISGSFLLIIIGMYEYVLSVIAHPITVGLKEINKLIPFIIGLILGILLLLKLMNYLLKQKFSLVYSIIIGFLFGSIFGLIPSFASFTEFLNGLILFALSLILSYKLTK